MADYKKGDLLILTHPFLFDSFVVGEVDKVTAKSVAVFYWTTRGRRDDEKPAIRRNDAIIGRLPGSDGLAAITRVREVIDQFDNAVKKAHNDLNRTIRDMVAVDR